MTSLSDQQIPPHIADWMIDVTQLDPLELGAFSPGNYQVRPTASLYEAQRAAIEKEGKPLRAIEGSGRTAVEDERIQRVLDTPPTIPPVLHQDFDDGSWGSLNGKDMPDGVAVVQRAVVRTGKQALQIRLTAKDKPFQAQLRDTYNPPMGEETWYGFSVRLPASFETDDSVTLAQWCDQVGPGEPSGKKPPMAIRYDKAGNIKITGDSGSPKKPTRTDLHTIAKVEKDAWLDFKFKMTWQKSGEATVTGFLNGEMIFEHKGPLGYPGRDLGPYFKLGLNTDSVSKDKPLTAYFDNYSHGQSSDDVDPGVPHKGI
jgi:hypothetical protein